MTNKSKKLKIYGKNWITRNIVTDKANECEITKSGFADLHLKLL